MPKVHSFTVIAELPDRLKPLRQLSNNLCWSWNHNSKSLFRRIAKNSNIQGRFNPVTLINSLSSSDVQSLLKDNGFLAQLNDLTQKLNEYLASPGWWHQELQAPNDLKVAYFSLEFGLHETLPLYSGGLGVLAGDHLKAASDLGVPLFAVGLLYYEGYFSQYLNADGWQQESYPQIQISSLPVAPALDKNGAQIVVDVPITGASVKARVWRVNVGRISLFLLDTNMPQNEHYFRTITSRLYGGDNITRIQQEIVLGIGGFRALQALGIEPDVFHMNEGHSAFLALEQLRHLVVQHKCSFEQALYIARSCNLFTTHTPVPAGNDIFPREMIEQYFSEFATELSIDIKSLLALGRIDESNDHEPFSMTVLALKASAAANAVSQLHSAVSRKLWQGLWPGVPAEETPISCVTNGIHTLTWISRDMAELFDRYLGPDWRDHVSLDDTWKPVHNIPDDELWRIRGRMRSLLVTHCRDWLRAQLSRRGAGRVEIENAGNTLNPEVLTIGFARRFATYKRAFLVLNDIERLTRIVSNTEHPVQFIFAGKAHPADHKGKEVIAHLIHAERRPELRGRFIYIEDYDMDIARHFIQGVDIWLNNPRRPLEACGTSGMKAAVNGGLNFSVLDGWWCEAFNGENGWSVGQGEEYEDSAYQDRVESRSIYDLLEREIIPTFYDRSTSDVPEEWLRLVKNSLSTIAPRFSASRMVSDYAKNYYLPLALCHRNLVHSDFRDLRKATSDISRFRRYWPEVSVVGVHAEKGDQIAIGQSLPIRVVAALGPFLPEEIAVEVRFGFLDVTNKLHDPQTIRLTDVHSLPESGRFEFSGKLEMNRAGSFGFCIRLVPVVNGKPEATLPGLIAWWG